MTLSHSLNHPQRLTLASEVHARPFMRIDAPAQISHLAIFSEADPALHHRALGLLCDRFGVARAAPDAKHFFHDFGVFRLKWENHTEFSTYTFVVQGAFEEPFRQTPIKHVPADWLQALGSSVMVAAHLALEVGEPMKPEDPALRKLFPGAVLVGSRAVKHAEVWTDFQIAADGYSKFLLRDTGLHELQAGRLVQRVCEIETYRMMALLALPLARETIPKIGELEKELSEVTQGMVNADSHPTDEELLHRLTRLAARIESLTQLTDYRFGAAQAYYRLVKARILELREERIDGASMIGEFMDRRLSPAIETCVSAAQRQGGLAERVSRTNDLLRTRVTIAQESQNQAVLQSLNRNAGLQVRLQQAVEGLSAVAISYYLVGLLSYGLKAGKSAGWPINTDLTLGALLPVACLATWWGLKRMHSRVHDKRSTYLGTTQTISPKPQQ